MPPPAVTCSRRAATDGAITRAFNQSLRCRNAAIQIYRADHCLHRIRQQRRLRSSAAALLAATQHQMFSQFQSFRHFRQMPSAHQRPPQPRQLSLAQLRIPPVQGLRRHQPHHGISEKLQRLVVFSFDLWRPRVGSTFMHRRAMRQRPPQQFLFLKPIIEDGLQRLDRFLPST